jgi:hypothetical protein
MNITSWKTKNEWKVSVAFIFLLAILASIHFFQKDLLVQTGDEPRLAYYSYSIAKGEMLKYPVKDYVEETGSVTPPHEIQKEPITLNIHNKLMFMMNSIVAPLMYTPALFFGDDNQSWKLLRTAAFFYFCGGLVFVWFSLRTKFSGKESFWALAFTGLSLPQAAQMSLGNTEQAAIFFLASSIYFLIFRRLSILSIFIGAISMCLVVYCSMRSVLLIGPVAVGFLVRLSRLKDDISIIKGKALFVFLITSILGGIGWVVMQLSFTGTVSGSSILFVNHNSDKTVSWFLHRLFVPILNHRDGILLLFPLFFCSLLGLVNASRKNDLVAQVSLVSLLSYYCLIAMTSQAEGYPGRLTFVLFELFSIGLAFYIRDFKNIASHTLLILGASVSLFLVYMHLNSPALLVQNRQFGLFQQMILEKTKIIDFGKYVIWDEYSIWTTPAIPVFESEAWGIGYKVVGFFFVLGLFFLGSISSRVSTSIRRASTYFAFVLILIGTMTFFVIPIADKSVSITRDSLGSRRSVNLLFDKAIGNKIIITFGQIPFWNPPEYPLLFSVVVVMEDGTTAVLNKRSMPEIRLAVPNKIRSITISSESTNAAWNNLPIKTYVPIV